MWKRHLETDLARRWAAEEEEAAQNVQAMLQRSNLRGGGSFSESQLDEFFRQLKRFAKNRNLSNLLYTSVGPKEFNDRLRDLYYGPRPFHDRIEAFVDMGRIGSHTLSQFLVAFDPSQYPLVSPWTKDMLELDNQQEEEAQLIALERSGIVDPTAYSPRTIRYLSDMVVFEAVREAAGLDAYNKVNQLLWLAKENVPEGDEEEGGPFTSVQFESDLRRYLAQNPQKIEKGLTVIGQEFDTGEVGRIDLLCADSKGRDVVVELKRGRKSDDVVGQVMRYLGWVEQHRNPAARGIIVVNEPDIRLTYAVRPMKDRIQVKFYRVMFEVSDTPSSGD